MNRAETSTPDREAAVEAAARALLSVSHDGRTSRVSLPIFYPSGAAATVEIEENDSRFLVSDGGLAYRETEMVGGEAMFGRAASSIAESFGIAVSKRRFSVFATIDQLAGAIADVGAASVQAASRVCERVAQKVEATIGALLYRRLVNIFGEQKVVADAEIAGASSHKWHLSALVHVDGKDMAFSAVSNHHSSVYSSATMFHDLSLLDRKPVAVAVVRDKSSFGSYLGMLSQAANVIEEGVPDATLARLAA